jgi:hypothetical protein
VHTVLREPDAAEYDLPGVLDWLRRWRANVYTVNGGGLCAFYQTQIPLHRKNRYLNGRDLLREIVEACHEAGIKVVARMDFRGGHREAFEAHPDWFSYDAEGRPRMTASLYAACPNSPFRNDGYAFAVVHEVLERCGADGIWENAASFGGRCYCPTCVRTFREQTGYRIPTQEDWHDPAWRRYVRWRYECIREHTRRLRDVVKAHGADKSYSGEFFSFLEGHARENAQDVDEIATLWDYQMACIFPLTRGSYHSPLLPVPVWRAQEQMKYLRATGGGAGGTGAVALGRDAAASASAPARPRAQTPVMLYGHFDNTSRYTTPAREELRLWLAAMAAEGGSPWDCSFVGVPPARWWDRRHNDVVEGFYRFLAEHEGAFQGLVSVAEVAAVHSQRTQDRFASGDPARDSYITHVRGWELALFASHVLWDVLPPSQLTGEKLRRYRAVVLANVACLTDGEADALRRFVAEGGVLLATYETGCYHADGSPRETGALDDVFGVRGLGLPPRGPLPYSYVRIRRRDLLTAGLDETEVITNEGYVRQVAAAGGQVHATLVPEVFPQPPDLSYPTLWDNDAPVLVTNRCGRGRALYFANQVDRLNVTSGHPDYQHLLANALSWALLSPPEPDPVAPTASAPGASASRGPGAARLLETNAPADVHVTLFYQPTTGRFYVHLVNYSGAHGRPVLAPRRTGPIALTLNLPALEVSPVSARLLVAAQDVPLAAERGRVRLTVPDVELYEVVQLAC